MKLEASIGGGALTLSGGAAGNAIDGATRGAGHVRVYNYTGFHWEQLGSDIDGAAGGDLSGWSVALDATGTTVAIGAYDHTAAVNPINQGQVRVFKWGGTTSPTWVQYGTDINGDSAGNQAGWSVSINAAGTVVVMGEPTYDGSAHGRTTIWYKTDNNYLTAWTLKGTEIIGVSTDSSGKSVSLNADCTTADWTTCFVAIGAPGHDSPTDAGTTRIYYWNSGASPAAWEQRGLDIDGDGASDFSGSSVSINAAGDTVAIGAFMHDGDDAGQVRVFKWNSGADPAAWEKRGSDIDGETASDEFGFSVSINAAGDTVAIGANENGGAGHARVYHFGTDWVLRGADLDGEAANDEFGYSVALDANGFNLVIGAPKHDSNGNYRLFEWTNNAYQYVYHVTFMGNLKGDLPLLEIDGTDVTLITTTAEVQTVDITATSGSFTLSFDGQSTVVLTVGASGNNVRDALQGLASIPTCTVVKTTSAHDDTYVVTFSDAANVGPQPLITVDDANLVHPFGAGATVTRTTPGIAKTTTTGAHTHGVAASGTHAGTPQDGSIAQTYVNQSTISMEYSLRYDYSPGHKTWTFALPGIGSILAAGAGTSPKQKKLVASKLTLVGKPTELQYMYIDTYDEAYYTKYFPGCYPLTQEERGGGCGFNYAEQKSKAMPSSNNAPTFPTLENGLDAKGAARACYTLPLAFRGTHPNIWEWDNLAQFSVLGTKFAVQITVNGIVNGQGTDLGFLSGSPPSHQYGRPTLSFDGWSDFPSPGVQWLETIPYMWNTTAWVLETDLASIQGCHYPMSEGDKGYNALCGVITEFITSDKTYRWPYVHTITPTGTYETSNTCENTPETKYTPQRFYWAIFKNIAPPLLSALGNREVKDAFQNLGGGEVNPAMLGTCYHNSADPNCGAWSLYGLFSPYSPGTPKRIYKLFVKATTVRATFDDVRKVLWIAASNDRTGIGSLTMERPDVVMTVFLSYPLNMAPKVHNLWTGRGAATTDTTKGPVLQFETNSSFHYCGGEWEMAVHDGHVVLSKLDGLVTGTSTNLVYTHIDEFSCAPSSHFDQVRPKFTEIHPGSYRAQMEYVDVPLDDAATGDDDGIPGTYVGLMDVPNIRDGFTAMLKYAKPPDFFTNARVNETCTQACMNFARNGTAMVALNGGVTCLTIGGVYSDQKGTCKTGCKGYSLLRFGYPPDSPGCPGFAVGDAVTYSANGQLAITGLSEETTYYVVAIPNDLSDFRSTTGAYLMLSTVAGGDPVPFTVGTVGNALIRSPEGATSIPCMTHAVQDSAMHAIYGNTSCLIPPTTRSIQENWIAAGELGQAFTEFYPTTTGIANWWGIYGATCTNGATATTYVNCLDLFVVPASTKWVVLTNDATNGCQAQIPESTPMTFTDFGASACGSFVTRTLDYIHVTSATLIVGSRISTSAIIKQVQTVYVTAASGTFQLGIGLASCFPAADPYQLPSWVPGYRTGDILVGASTADVQHAISTAAANSNTAAAAASDAAVASGEIYMGPWLAVAVGGQPGTWTLTFDLDVHDPTNFPSTICIYDHPDYETTGASTLIPAADQTPEARVSITTDGYIPPDMAMEHLVCGDGDPAHCGGAKFNAIKSVYGHGQYIYLVDFLAGDPKVRYLNTHSHRVYNVTSNWTLTENTKIYADDWFVYLRASASADTLKVYEAPSMSSPNNSTFLADISLSTYTGPLAMAGDHLYVVEGTSGASEKDVFRLKSLLYDTSECFDMEMGRNVETPIGAICICGERDASQSDVLDACPAEAVTYANGTVEPNSTYRWRTHPASMIMGEFYSHKINTTEVDVYNDCSGVCSATGASCIETLDLTGSDLTLFNDLYGINCDDRMEDVFRLGQFGYESEQDVCFGIVNSRQCGSNSYDQYSNRGDYYYCCCGDPQSLDCAGYAPGSTRTMYVPFVNRTCHGFSNLTHVKHVGCPIAALDLNDPKFIKECECENMCDAEPGCTGYNLLDVDGHYSCSFYASSITMTNTSNVTCYCNSQTPGCQTHFFDPQTPAPTPFPTIPPLDPAEVTAMDRAMMFKPSLPPSLAPTTAAPTIMPTVYVPTAAPFKGHLPTIAKIPNFWVYIVIVAMLACAVIVCIVINAVGKGKCCIWVLRKCPNATYCVACVVPAYICCAACRSCVPKGCRKVDWKANYCIIPGLAPTPKPVGLETPLVPVAPTKPAFRRRRVEYRLPFLKIE